MNCIYWSSINLSMTDTSQVNTSFKINYLRPAQSYRHLPSLKFPLNPLNAQKPRLNCSNSHPTWVCCLRRSRGRSEAPADIGSNSRRRAAILCPEVLPRCWRLTYGSQITVASEAPISPFARSTKQIGNLTKDPLFLLFFLIFTM